MTSIDFKNAFCRLTDVKEPFPWQTELFQRFIDGRIPGVCNLPTGLGKTAVIPIWLLGLAVNPEATPRRLVYVVNRRTVVDQATNEAKKLRERLPLVDGLMERLTALCAEPWDTPLSISTLRGQFADDGEWRMDPSRPGIIVGTVDMIGSRLLFSGYGVGYKARPLHAGFLGQDVLLVHDEAHLEPAFQELLIAIEKEQQRCKEYRAFRVMELSATSRGQKKPFELTEIERNPPDKIPDPPTESVHVVWRRLQAKKAICLHKNADEKRMAEQIAHLALDKFKDSKLSILIFLRRVDDVEKSVEILRRANQQVQQLTGTMRGLERDAMVEEDAIFRRFLPKARPENETVYLVCTSAGEVGVNISANHLVCDLSTFDSMAQRFGRVNRFGDRDDTEIHVVFPKEFDEKKESDIRRKRTLDLLRRLDGNGSPKALGELDAEARRAAFAPTPAILPATDILFDSWALTSICGKLPGRPPVEPYLHGISEWEPPETRIAWREEVEIIVGELLEAYKPEDMLDNYPLKPHELLRDISSRVFDRLKKLGSPDETPVWIVSDDDSVKVVSLGELIKFDKEVINYKTVVLPPRAGGLEKGMLTAGSSTANDVADEWRDEMGQQRRIRVWEDDPQFDRKTSGMRLIGRIQFQGDGEDEQAQGRSWLWFERPGKADNEGSKFAQEPILWQEHTDYVGKNAAQIVAALKLPQQIQVAIKLAAKFHDLGKKREVWQRSIGNPNPTNWLAKLGRDKAGKLMNPVKLTDYRHELGSLVDAQSEAEFEKLSCELKDLVLHIIAAHHGRGRPYFPLDEAFDPDPKGRDLGEIVANVPQRFARLQRKYGRWGLAYLESLLRAADWAASAKPSTFAEVKS